MLRRQWIFAAPIDQAFAVWSCEDEAYKNVTFTEQLAARYVLNTNKAIEAWAADAAEAGTSPFLPPVLKEHVAGWRGGSIHGARVAGEGLKRGIYLDVSFLPDVAADVEAEHTNFVSIGTLPAYTDYRGREWSSIIHELSITENPRLKSLGTIQDTEGLRLSDALSYGVKKMDEQQIADLMEKLESIESKQDAIEGRLTQIEGAMKIEEKGEDKVEEGATLADAETMKEGEEADPAVKLADALVARATKIAAEKMGAIRLGEIKALPNPTKKLSRREEGIKKGLKGNALAEYSLGINS